jgi:hypothetical protein
MNNKTIKKNSNNKRMKLGRIRERIKERGARLNLKRKNRKRM